MGQYTVQWNEQETRTLNLPEHEPIYRFLPDVIEQLNLPATDEQQRPIRYGLFDAGHHRLNDEKSLMQNGQQPGSTLYIANRSRVWWAPASANQAVPQPIQSPWYAIRGRLTLPIVFGVALIAVIAILFSSIIARAGVSNGSQSDTDSQPTTVTSVASFVQLASPTPIAVATLAPTPSPIPTTQLVEPPTATPSPTVEPVTVAGIRQEYSTVDSRLFYRGRTSFGAFLWKDVELQEKMPATNGFVVVSNGDQIEIIARLGPVYQVRVLTNALDPNDPQVIGAVGYLPAWMVTNQDVPPTPTPQPKPTPTPKLRIAKVNENDAPDCISMQIRGINANGWLLRVDGYQLTARFDGGGNARLCRVPGHAFTFSVLDNAGRPVPGGQGIPAKGRDIFIGEWR